MTKNKAVETLKYIKTFDGMDFGKTRIALDMAIKALEEIQQCRAIQKMIGIPLEDFAKLCVEKVPEECKNPKKAIILTDEDVDKWQAYKAIGTVEEVQTQITKSTEWLIERDKRLAEYQAFIKKMDGHDKEIKAKAIDEFANRLRDVSFPTHENYSAIWLDSVEEIAEKMKGSDENG